MAKSKFESVDDYLEAQPASARSALARVRAVIWKALPRAEEVISYQIPTYKLEGRAVIYFAGWKQHYSLYPVSDAVRVAVGEALRDVEVEKGTIRFALSEPVPTKLVERIVKARAEEVTAGPIRKRPAKKTKKKAAGSPRKVRSKRATSRSRARSGA